MHDPHPLTTLLHMAGAVALLIWSVRLVRTGVERIALHQLRSMLRATANSPILGGLTGTLMALVLQSSTAVALVVASFIKHHSLHLTIALGMILGADLGSALVARLLVSRPDILLPILLLAGILLFLRSQQRNRRQMGRILIGLALIFLSLDLLAQATLPLKSLPWIENATAYFDEDPLSSFALAALLAWIMHSSVAAILLIASLAMAGLLTGQAGLAMVLGANLGGAFIAVGLTLREKPAVKQVMISNLVLRGGGAILGLWFLSSITGQKLSGKWLPDWTWPGEVADQILWSHVGFNGLLFLFGLLLATLVLRLTKNLGNEDPIIPTRNSALDKEALTTPTRALGCARREVLRMGEEVDAMLRTLKPLFESWNDGRAAALLEQEQALDSMHFETKLYLSKLQPSLLTPQQLQEAQTLVTLAGHIEAAGDEISTTLLGIANRLHQDQKRFSEAGWKELTDFLERVQGTIQKSLDLLMRPERDLARSILEDKDALRGKEDQLQLSHLNRLQKGVETSVETSNLHQSMLRSLKQINSSMAQIAYPLLEENGDLRATRLSS